MSAVIDVQNLQTYFHTDRGVVKAVDDISFQIEPGHTLGVVGESGSGKSVTSLTIMRLLAASAQVERFHFVPRPRFSKSPRNGYAENPRR